MSVPRILMNCIRMHRQGDGALSGNFYHCLRLIEQLEQMQAIDLHVHVDHPTHPYLAQVISPDRLVVEDRAVNSIVDMERSIRKAVRRLTPNLYHKPTGQLPLLPTSCPTVWGVADLGYRHLPMGRLQRLYKHVSYRTSAKKAAKVIAVSNSTRQQLINAVAVSPAKVRTIYHGTTRFAEEPVAVAGLPESYVMTFAHQRHKNVELAISAVALARSRGVRIPLVVVGSLNYRAELEAAAEYHNVADDVIYTGHVSDGQLRYLYEHALCLLFLSRHEGFGLPVLEAMAARCPVIASTAFALPEVAGDAAPLFDCDDAEGVAGEIQRLVASAGYRHTLIDRGLKNTERFSWQRAAEQTVQVYHEVLTRNGVAST